MCNIYIYFFFLGFAVVLFKQCPPWFFFGCAKYFYFVKTIISISDGKKAKKGKTYSLAAFFRLKLPPKQQLA